MRYLKLKTQDPIYLPILDKLIQEAESSSETERLILNNLSRSLTQDLSENQYKIIINEIVNYYENYRRRWDNSKENQFKSWVIQQTMLRSYFIKGIFLDDIRNPN